MIIQFLPHIFTIDHTNGFASKNANVTQCEMGFSRMYAIALVEICACLSQILMEVLAYSDPFEMYPQVQSSNEREAFGRRRIRRENSCNAKKLPRRDSKAKCDAPKSE